jgi:hypothetical protein
VVVAGGGDNDGKQQNDGIEVGTASGLELENTNKTFRGNTQ